jgi:hypothetical protein
MDQPLSCGWTAAAALGRAREVAGMWGRVCRSNSRYLAFNALPGCLGAAKGIKTFEQADRDAGIEHQRAMLCTRCRVWCLL